VSSTEEFEEIIFSGSPRERYSGPERVESLKPHSTAAAMPTKASVLTREVIAAVAMA
jgi:hypothetical protein